jgi:Holliday junction resolvase
MKSENEMQNKLELCGLFAIRSSGSRSPSDVTALKGKESILVQIKETSKNKLYVGNAIKDLNRVVNDFGLTSKPILAIKFLSTGKWLWCDAKKMVSDDITAVPNDNCKDFECPYAKEDDNHERPRKSQNSLMDSYR